MELKKYIEGLYKQNTDYIYGVGSTDIQKGFLKIKRYNQSCNWKMNRSGRDQLAAHLH